MATGVLLEFQGIGEKEYERLIKELRTEQNPPEGGVLHTAGPLPNGWRVFNIFESRESYEKFYNDRVTPALKLLGMPNPSRKELYPIHNVMAYNTYVLNTLNVLGATTTSRR